MPINLQTHFRRLVYPTRAKTVSLKLLVVLCLWLSLAPPGRAQAEKPANGVISGRLLVGEKPAPNVAVVARRAQPNQGGNEGPPSAKAVTDADGYYRLSGLPAGSFTVLPVNPVFIVREQPTRLGSAGRSVTLGEGETLEKVDFNLVKGGVITGRVVDHEGKPAVGESVTLLQLKEQGKTDVLRLPNYRMFEIDDRGNYRLFGIPEGRYKVYVGQVTDGTSLCLGCGTNYTRRTFYPSVTEDAEAQIIDVTAGNEITEIDIRLAGYLKSFDVVARVVDAETGQPVAGVQCGYGMLSKDRNRLNGYGTGMVSGPNGEVYFQAVLTGNYGAFAQGLPDKYSELTTFEVTDADL